MATSHSQIFKTLSSEDITSTRTLLHENVPITGTIVSGALYAGGNIKNYSHGMFQSVYDYPYLSSSANHLFDLTCGYQSGTVGSFDMNSQKQNIYAQMAQVLVGHDATGAIRPFDQDGDLSGGPKIESAYFLNMSRLLTKDEIKKGTFSLSLGTGSLAGNEFDFLKEITDSGADTSYKVNSPAGEYGLLYTSSAGPSYGDPVGLLYYQAGIAVLTASVFGAATEMQTGQTAQDQFQDDPISSSADAFRHRFDNLTFNNTIELNSTIYFCNANHNEFNYSSNPTYLSESKIRVKSEAIDSPSSYITTVGMYSAKNELLATAKLSEPLKKDPATSLTLRVRLDY
jgi:hypothetical protein